MPALLAALLATAVLAGCGGGEQEPIGAGADLVPADSALFVALDTNFDGDDWREARSLLDEFPAGQDLLREARVGMEELEAAGPETDLVLLEASEDPDEWELVVLTKPPDREEYVRSLAGDLVHETIDRGWVAASRSRGALDAFLAAREGERLAGSAAFESVMEGFEGDALARAYATGEAIEAASRERPGAFAGLCGAGGVPAFAGAVVRVEDDALHLEATGRPEGGDELEPYDPELTSELPDRAVAFLSFSDVEGQFAAVREDLGRRLPELERQLARTEASLGISLERDVLPLLAGEGALALHRETLVPSATLLLEVEDEERALGALDRLARRVSVLRPDAEGPRRIEVGGLEARELSLSPAVSLLYAAFEGRAVVTTARSGLEAVVEDGSSFEDDEGFREAAEAAGMPDETTGFAYVDADAALELAEDVAAFSGGEGISPEARANLEPLERVLFHGSSDACFDAFLGIE